MSGVMVYLYESSNQMTAVLVVARSSNLASVLG